MILKNYFFLPAKKSLSHIFYFICTCVFCQDVCFQCRVYNSVSYYASIIMPSSKCQCISAIERKSVSMCCNEECRLLFFNKCRKYLSDILRIFIIQCPSRLVSKHECRRMYPKPLRLPFVGIRLPTFEWENDFFYVQVLPAQA